MLEYEYEIYYRLDSSELMETSSVIVKSDSVSNIIDTIIQIELNNTIISIKNLKLS